MAILASLLPLPARFKSPATNPFEISPMLRAIILAAATGMSLAVTIALFRGLTGIAPEHSNFRNLAIILHVATVIPAIPLGGYLLLARKGTARHRQLGKLWVGLMVVTALSALFIQTGGSFSFIHIFVPLTLWSSYKLVATARRGDMKAHRWEILTLYLGALMIPGIFSMAIPGRLMNVWLFG